MTNQETVAKDFANRYLSNEFKVIKETKDEIHINNVGLKSKDLIKTILNFNYLTGMNGNVVTVKYNDVRIVIHCDV